MRCNELKYNLPDFVKGDISEQRKLEIESHVKSCPRCASEIAVFTKTFLQIQSSKIDEPSQTYWSNFIVGVNNKIYSQRSRWYQSKWIVKVAMPAIAGIILCFVFIKYVHFTPTYTSFDVITKDEIVPILAQSSDKDLQEVITTYENNVHTTFDTTLTKVDQQLVSKTINEVEYRLFDLNTNIDVYQDVEYLSTNELIDELSEKDAIELIARLEKTH